MTQTDDERWAQWCSDFDEVEREVINLFDLRSTWRALGTLMNNGSHQQYGRIHNYFTRTYVATVCTAIRREADYDDRTNSLARCLQALIDCPHFASRTRYETLRADAFPGVDPAAIETSGFDRYSGGGEFIDVAIIQAALERLHAASLPIRSYTNKALAHRERDRKINLSFDQINFALAEVGEVVKQFYTLRHPGEHLGALTPLDDFVWARMFEKPWFTDAWKPPPTGPDADGPESFTPPPPTPQPGITIVEHLFE